MNYREEEGIYEVDTPTLPALLHAARDSVNNALNEKKGLRYIFARRDLQAELEKYDRIITVLAELDMNTLYIGKPLIDNLAKPGRLDEPAWLGTLQKEAQTRFISTRYAHLFLRNPDSETLEKLREELEKTPLGHHTLEILDQNNIEVVFGPPLQIQNLSPVHGEYMPHVRKLWLAYSGLEDMAASAVHEATHVKQNYSAPEIFKFHDRQERREYRHKVYGYTAMCLTEALAYAAEDLYKADKQGLYKPGSEKRVALLNDARSVGFSDTDEDFRKFLYLAYFARILQSNPEQLQYEQKFIDSEVAFYSDFDFRVCVKTSPYIKPEFLERLCVDENGECFLPPDPKAREESCRQIASILTDPVMLRRPRMTCMPGTFKP
jgi:hypothetical protein